MEKEEIYLDDNDAGSIEELVLSKSDRWVDPMSRNGVSLHRNGEVFTATLKAYEAEDPEEFTIDLTRAEVLEALDWDNI